MYLTVASVISTEQKQPKNSVNGNKGNSKKQLMSIMKERFSDWFDEEIHVKIKVKHYIGTIMKYTKPAFAKHFFSIKSEVVFPTNHVWLYYKCIKFPRYSVIFKIIHSLW